MSILFLEINEYPIYAFIWNIFLAIIPVLLVFFLSKTSFIKLIDYSKSAIVIFVFIFFVWLLFLPNTAYLLTISRHLVDYCSIWNLDRVCINNNWIVTFFTLYSVIGIPTFYYALKKMSLILEGIIGRKWGIIIPPIIIPLVSIGVFMGLFERLNSWDFFARPLNVINSFFSYFTDLNKFINFIFFTAMLYFIYYVIEALRNIK